MFVLLEILELVVDIHLLLVPQARLTPTLIRAFPLPCHPATSKVCRLRSIALVALTLPHLQSAFLPALTPFAKQRAG